MLFIVPITLWTKKFEHGTKVQQLEDARGLNLSITISEIVKNRRKILHLMHINTIKIYWCKTIFRTFLTLCLFQCIHNVQSRGNRTRVISWMLQSPFYILRDVGSPLGIKTCFGRCRLYTSKRKQQCIGEIHHWTNIIDLTWEHKDIVTRIVIIGLRFNSEKTWDVNRGCAIFISESNCSCLHLGMSNTNDPKNETQCPTRTINTPSFLNQ